MCGIWGWSLPESSGVTKEQRAVLGAVLGSLNDNRGGDSYGLYYVNGTQRIERGLGYCIDFEWPKLAEARIVVGHTRKATQGAKTVENAHPYEIGDLIGAHNGMISNHDELNKKYDRKLEVDSMHIFHHLSEGKDLSELTGYGVIEYVNKKLNPELVTLVNLRHGELAIYGLGKVGNCRGTIWSSSKNHLLTALAAAGLLADSFEYEAKESQTYQVIKGTLYYGPRKLSLSETKWETTRSIYSGGNWGSYSDYEKKYKPRTHLLGSGASTEKRPVRIKVNAESENGYVVVYEGTTASYYDVGAMRDFLGEYDITKELEADQEIDMTLKQDPIGFATGTDDAVAASAAIIEDLKPEAQA